MHKKFYCKIGTCITKLETRYKQDINKIECGKLIVDDD